MTNIKHEEVVTFNLVLLNFFLSVVCRVSVLLSGVFVGGNYFCLQSGVVFRVLTVDSWVSYLISSCRVLPVVCRLPGVCC